MIILLAQVCCWRATLTLDHLWHAAEEALWVVMIALVFVCCVLGFVHFDGIQRGLMAIGIVACVGAAYVMLVVDIPMYLARSRATGRRKNEFLPVGEGFRDTLARRVPTSEWSVWKAEVMWITTYFTVGVWLSIGMVFARF